MPLTSLMVLKFFFRKLEKERKELNATTAKRKGTPSPTEYAARRNTPFNAVSFVAASIKMLESIGPIQGVHAAAKVIPIINAPSTPLRFFLKAALL